jgi:acyl-CoA hydrolase
MKRVDDIESLDFGALLRAGDTVLWGQVCAEPTLLTQQLMAQRHRIGQFQVFMGFRTANTLQPEHADAVHMLALNAGGANRVLAKAGVLDMVPMHVSQVESAIRTGLLPCDVVLVQVSPPDAQGRHSLGLTGDYLRAAIERARVVIAEVNAQVPWVPCDTPLTAADIDFAVHVDCPLPQVPAATVSPLDTQIATWAAPYIGDGATIQFGIGGVPDALMLQLRDRKRLGVHSGMLSDGFVDLVECGAITNEHKPFDRGVSVTGALMGTQRLYRLCHQNPAVRLAPLSYTHDPVRLAQLPNLVSINSALEIDLTGQVNAEALGPHTLGGVGGQVDFVRGAALSPGGRSIMALGSITPKGASRIVAQLSGPVTTARSDVDLVVTEHGVAELRGRSLRQRIRAMIAIADPSQREALERAAHPLTKESGA